MKTLGKIALLSFMWGALLVCVGIYGGWLTLTNGSAWVLHPVLTLYRHLEFSLVPFALLFVIYFYLIADLRRLLKDSRTPLFKLTYRDRLLNLTISSFFGVGVICTAVGIENALFQALAGFNPSVPAAEQSPWALLERLVNGGLVLALSTTIFGGICGYGLRLIKVVLIGSRWDQKLLSEANVNESCCATV